MRAKWSKEDTLKAIEREMKGIGAIKAAVIMALVIAYGESCAEEVGH